jgi:hypothetical protein
VVCCGFDVNPAVNDSVYPFLGPDKHDLDRQLRPGRMLGDSGENGRRPQSGLGFCDVELAGRRYQAFEVLIECLRASVEEGDGLEHGIAPRHGTVGNRQGGGPGVGELNSPIPVGQGEDSEDGIR